MQSRATERRQSIRYGLKDVAELASGQALVSVRIDDMSATGCGVVILNQGDDVANRLGATGLLSFRQGPAGQPAVVLPVLLCELRRDGTTLRYGLRFRQLTTRQAGRLAALMAEFAPTSVDGTTDGAAERAASPLRSATA